MPSIKDHSPDEFLDAFREDPTNPPLALYAGAALDAAGRTEEAVAVWTFGDDVDPILRTLWRSDETQGELKTHSRRADEAIRQHFTSLSRKIVDETGGAELDRVREGVWVQYATEPFQYRAEKQQPVIFYMPGIDPTPVYGGDELDFARAIEASYDDIRKEWEEAAAADVTQYPYVSEDIAEPVWQDLRGKMDWSALYLHFNAAETKEAMHFPETLKALGSAPQVKRGNIPLETFFSKLQPGAKIPPHFGLTNTRLTVHFPLIVPGDCAIRVGDDICKWEEGKIIGFDDSFEHEAWNQSDSDRVVLIFETHHPDLTPSEIEAIESVYGAFDKWVAGRAKSLGVDARKFIHPDAGGI